jgi:hypothetical protein
MLNKQAIWVTLLVATVLALANWACCGTTSTPRDLSAAETTAPGDTSSEGSPLPGDAAAKSTATSPPSVPTVDTSDCTLGAVFAADVTIPDNTPIDAGQSFAKTWSIRNTGTCDWGPGYLLTFIDGDRMGGPQSVSIPETAAGEAAEISVELVAPAEARTHRGSWQMCVNKTKCFGDKVYVQIISVAPTPAPDPEVIAYFEATDELLLEKAVELAAVGELLKAHAANPAVYYSEDWHDAMEYHILGWYEYTDELQRYEPIPAAVSEYHEELLLMVEHEDEAQDYLLLWIDTPDISLLEQATAHIEKANEHTETAYELRESLGY